MFFIFWAKYNFELAVFNFTFTFFSANMQEYLPEMTAILSDCNDVSQTLSFRMSIFISKKMSVLL